MTQSSRTRSNGLRIAGALVLIAALAGGGLGIWYLFLQPAAPAPVNIANVPLPSASALATATGGASPTVATDSPAPAGTSAAGRSGTAASPTAAAITADGLDGTWTVDQTLGSFSDFTSSFVGYRIKEELASIGANTVVGRTPAVTGTLTLAGALVTAAEFTADLRNLTSDDGRRDGQLARQGIETSRFPEATFTLTEPIDLGTLPGEGEAIRATATGDFTLHGVTQSVQVHLDAKRSADTIVVTGSLPIAFADYDIAAPTSFVVLSIDDHGTMEFQLLFTKR